MVERARDISGDGRRLSRWTPARAALLAACVLCACGARPEAAEAPAEEAVVDTEPTGPSSKLFFIPGELMNFEFRFRDVLVGRAALAVGQPGTVDDRPSLIVRSQVETAGLGKVFKVVKDDVSTWIDTSVGRPFRQKAELLFGEKDLALDIRFAGRQVDITFERRGPQYQGPRKRFARSRRRYRMPDEQFGLDAHAILGAIRSWEPKRGQKRYFFGVSGRRVWYTELTASGSDTRRTKMGMYPVLRFDGVAERLTYRMVVDDRRKPRTFTMWLSDDANRLPLLIEGKTEYGDVAIELIDYQKTGTVP